MLKRCRSHISPTFNLKLPILDQKPFDKFAILLRTLKKYQFLWLLDKQNEANQYVVIFHVWIKTIKTIEHSVYL